MTLFGIGVGTQTAGGTGVVYSRNCGAGSPIQCNEARVQLDTGNPTFRYGANRNGPHYGDLTQNFPDAYMAQDKLYNRLPLVSMKYNGGSTLWSAIGSATAPGNPIRDRINLVGLQIASWQNANAGVGKWGSTFMWTFHHEPNNDIPGTQGADQTIGGANWKAAFLNIIAIWRAAGVRFWQGGSNLSTTTEGIIPIINLVSGIASNHANDINLYWGNDPNMNRECRGYMGDPYNIGTQFRTFENINSDLKAWSDPKKISQNAQGYSFMQGIWETGTRDTNGYTGVHSSWSATGLTANKPNWYLNASQYLKTSYTDCALWTYYDDAPANSNQPDQTQASWNSWLLNFCTNDFDIATSPIPSGGPPPPPPPPPPGDFFPGVVPVTFRAKIGG